MNNVKTIRGRLGLSQTALAAALGQTPGNVGHYERGQTVPPEVARKLIALCRARGLVIGFDHVYAAADIPAPVIEPVKA